MVSRASYCATSSISPCKNSIVWQQESRKKQGQERKKNMLSQSQRTTILELHAQGVKKREIARVLGISRLSVRKVLRSNSPQVPLLQRAEKADRKSTRLNSSHLGISYAVFCLKKKIHESHQLLYRLV